MCWPKRVTRRRTSRDQGDTGEPTTRQKTGRAHRRPAEQEKAALTGILQPVGTALQRLTGMHKSKVTGHSAYLSASTAPGTDGDVEVLWYSSQVRACPLLTL